MLVDFTKHLTQIVHANFVEENGHAYHLPLAACGWAHVTQFLDSWTLRLGLIVYFPMCGFKRSKISIPLRQTHLIIMSSAYSLPLQEASYFSRIAERLKGSVPKC